MATHEPRQRERLWRNPVAELGVVLLDDIERLTRTPATFFRTNAREHALYAPLLVGLLAIQLAIVVAGLLMLAGVGGVQGAAYIVLYLASVITGQQMAGLELTGTGFLTAVVLAPIVGTLLVLGASVLVHSLVVLAVGDANTGFRNTFRVVGYASIVNAVNWIPVIGLLLNLFGLYLVTLGVREAHRAKTWRAAAVGLTPPLAFVVFFILLQVLPE